MGELFDDISRVLASPMPRRRVLGLIVGALAGGTLTGIERGRATALGIGPPCGPVTCAQGQKCCDARTGICCTHNHVCCPPGSKANCCRPNTECCAPVHAQPCCPPGKYCCKAGTGGGIGCCSIDPLEECCPNTDESGRPTIAVCCPIATPKCCPAGSKDPCCPEGHICCVASSAQACCPPGTRCTKEGCVQVPR